jgi:ABC-type branched-subunit amino acid transport system permease subunit
MLVIGGFRGLSGAVGGTALLVALTNVLDRLQSGANVAFFHVHLPTGSEQIYPLARRLRDSR